MPERRAAASGAKADALRLLKLRPRSERELRARLERKGHEAAAVDAILQELKERGLVDDARLFGLSTRAVSAPSASIAHCVPPIEEARVFAARQSGRMKGLDAPAKARRLAGFLSRRGFEEEVVEQVVREVVPHDGG